MMREIHDIFEQAALVKGALTYDNVKTEVKPTMAIYVVFDKYEESCASFAILEGVVIKLHETVIEGFAEVLIEMKMSDTRLMLKMKKFNGESADLLNGKFNDKSRVFIDKEYAEAYVEQLRLTYEVMKESQLGGFKGWSQQFKEDDKS